MNNPQTNHAKTTETPETISARSTDALGFHHITAERVAERKKKNPDFMIGILKKYYFLDTGFTTLFSTVCAEATVPFPLVENQLIQMVEDPENLNTSIAILGTSGCGKTTLMMRMAVYFARKDHPVLITDIASGPPIETEPCRTLFKEIYNRHNRRKDQKKKPVLVFMDNPATCRETMCDFLGGFKTSPRGLRFIFILLEQESEYYFAANNHNPLRINDTDKIIFFDHRREDYETFRNEVVQRLTAISNPGRSERSLLRETLERQYVPVGEVSANIYKKIAQVRQSPFMFQWEEMTDYLDKRELPVCREMFEYTATVHQFGMCLPLSLLQRILRMEPDDGSLNPIFADLIIKGEKHINFTLLREGDRLQIRHPIIARWYVDAFLDNKIQHRMLSILANADLNDRVEANLFHTVISSRNIIKRTLGGVTPEVLEKFNGIFAESADPVLHFKVAMFNAYIHSFARRFETAIRQLEAIVGDHPDYHPAALELGYCYYATLQYKKSAAILEELIQRAPKLMKARSRLSKVYRDQKRMDEAEAVLLESLKLAPRLVKDRIELSKIYQRMKKWSKAEAILESALEIEKYVPLGHVELSKIYRIQDKWFQAEEILLNLLRRDPNCIQAYTELSKIYQNRGDMEMAEKILLQSLEIDNLQLHPRTELNRIYQKTLKWTKAEAILKELLKLEPDSVHGNTEMATLYNRWANDSRRKELFHWKTQKHLYYHYVKRSYEIKPDNIPTLMQLCSIFNGFRQYRAALVFLQKTAEAGPIDLETIRQMIFIYHRLHNMQKVKELYEQGNEMISARPDARYKDRFQLIPNQLRQRGICPLKLIRQDNMGIFRPPVVVDPQDVEVPLAPKFSHHFSLVAGNLVFFGTYEKDGAVVADCIEPAFEEVTELGFFNKSEPDDDE